MARRSIEERMAQPGEAQTRYYLAHLGWVRPEDAEGGPPVLDDDAAHMAPGPLLGPGAVRA